MQLWLLILAGVWFTVTDCSQADRISPPPTSVDPQGWFYAAYAKPQTTFPGITSLHATRFRTILPLAGTWGANANITFSPLPIGDGGSGVPSNTLDASASDAQQRCTQPTSLDYPADAVDLSAYSGITFWAMTQGTGARVVRVLFNDKDTDPLGGICNPDDPKNTSNCYNGFRKELLVTDVLTQYTVEFSSLHQDPTWGYRPEPSVFDLQHVYSTSFEIDLPTCTESSNFKCAGGPPTLTFDIWIDDLYFVNK